MENDLNQLKILVCSVNAWNSRIGDNTFAQLLRDLPKENIASLFIREDVPDSPVCDNYFRISEMKVINSIMRSSVHTGARVFPQKVDNAHEVEEHDRIYRRHHRLYYPKLFAREALWMMGKWNSDELNEFVDSFSPDIVMYEMGRYIHLNRIVKYILERTGAKGIGCFWDDTFTYKQETSLGFKFFRFFQRKSIQSLACSTSAFFAITPKTKREADAFLGIDCTVLTKPATVNRVASMPGSQFPLKMLYTGNLTIGREATMAKIVECLHEVNRHGKKLVLDIYTNTRLSDENMTKLQTACSTVHGAVSQEKVLELQNQSDILLFVEGIGTRNKIARLSFSTKIVDYLAAGKCIFAVGDADLAPMELFEQEKTAVIATDPEQILAQMMLLTDLDMVHAFARRAHDVYIQNYSADQVWAKFYRVLTSV